MSPLRVVSSVNFYRTCILGGRLNTLSEFWKFMAAVCFVKIPKNNAGHCWVIESHHCHTNLPLISCKPSEQCWPLSNQKELESPKWGTYCIVFVTRSVSSHCATNLLANQSLMYHFLVWLIYMLLIISFSICIMATPSVRFSFGALAACVFRK